MRCARGEHEALERRERVACTGSPAHHLSPMRALVALACLALAGCGTGLREGELRIELPVVDVPPGDSFGCYFSDVIVREALAVVGATAQQAETGHHVSLYFVEVPRPVGVVACELADTAELRFVLEARRAGDVAPASGMPEGHGVLVPTGAQLVVLAHHASAETSDTRALDVLSLDTTAPDSVTLEGELSLRTEPTVPSGAPHASVSECVLDRDVTLTSLRAQLGPTGARYALERVTGDGDPEPLFDTPWQDSLVWHPPAAPLTIEAPLELRAGERLRQACEWLNTTGEALTFPAERCEAFARYVGDAQVACEP